MAPSARHTCPPQEQLAYLVLISMLYLQVEDAFGGAPQDVEGVYSDGKITVVQARPQVL